MTLPRVRALLFAGLVSGCGPARTPVRAGAPGGVAASAACPRAIEVSAGGVITVPSGVRWRVRSVSVRAGASLPVRVDSLAPGRDLEPGETLTAPAWTAASELLTQDATTASYLFELEERPLDR